MAKHWVIIHASLTAFHTYCDSNNSKQNQRRYEPTKFRYTIESKADEAALQQSSSQYNTITPGLLFVTDKIIHKCAYMWLTKMWQTKAQLTGSVTSVCRTI